MREFFALRRLQHDADPSPCGYWDYCMDDSAPGIFADIEARWADADTVEFWADPDPNAQLLLLQFLSWCGRRDLHRSDLHLVQADGPLGDRRADDIRSATPKCVQVEDELVQDAVSAWDAFCSPTPERWAALLGHDFPHLPRLRSAVLRILEELPDKLTGLDASQARVIGGVARGADLRGLFHDGTAPRDGAVLDYWEFGKLLDLLRSVENAVTGLRGGPFDNALHDDAARLKRYWGSRPALSALGQGVFNGAADYLEHASIDRWWGGTRLTNDRTWRWDSADQVLVPPR